MRSVFFIFLFFSTPLLAQPQRLPKSKEAALLKSLDPTSVTDHLALYQLYPETTEGKQALTIAWDLLQPGTKATSALPLPALEIERIIALVTTDQTDKEKLLSKEQLAVMQQLSLQLEHQRLKGHQAWSTKEVLALPSEQIDLARALLLFQFDGQSDKEEKVLQYEALLDLMALQIRAKGAKTDQEKIKAISRFIFHEMRFRFPPHSVHSTHIDEYTFLPSVLDGRQGVCLGVSILYLSLAQRLGLELESVTPPGHIFVRYCKGDQLINIETTNRGVHIPSEHYLGVNTKELQVRSIKEVVGMAFVNKASVLWQKEEYEEAVSLYEKAQLLIPDDPLLKMLLGLNYLFVGKISEGRSLLAKIRSKPFPGQVISESLPEDFLNGKIDVDGLKKAFLPVDEKRCSILQKQEELKKTLLRYPKFRMGLMQLATTYLQLGRNREAMQVLEKYHRIDQNNPTVEYYLTLLALESRDYNKAWEHLESAKKITGKQNYLPGALKSTQQQLRKLSPS